MQAWYCAGVFVKAAAAAASAVYVVPVVLFASEAWFVLCAAEC